MVRRMWKEKVAWGLSVRLAESAPAEAGMVRRRVS
jgi:hypothetical protein